MLEEGDGEPEGDVDVGGIEVVAESRPNVSRSMGPRGSLDVLLPWGPT